MKERELFWKSISAEERTYLEKVFKRSVFFDIETTGLSPETEGIWQAAISGWGKGRYETILNKLVSPRRHWIEDEKVILGERITFGRMSQWSQNAVKRIIQERILTSPNQKTGVYEIDEELKRIFAGGTIDPENPEFKALINSLAEAQLELAGTGKAVTRGATLTAATSEWLGGPGIEQTRLVGEFYKKVSGKTVWVHNIRFESRFFESLTTKGMFSRLTANDPIQTFSLGQRTFYVSSPDIDVAISKTFQARTRGEFLGQWEKVFTQGYEPELLGQTRWSRLKGTRFLDSQKLVSSIMAMAQKRGIMAETGDVFTGTNLDLLAQIMFGEKELHAALEDTRLAGYVSERMMLMGQRMAMGKELLFKDRTLLETLGRIQPQIREQLKVKTLLSATADIAAGRFFPVSRRTRPWAIDVFGTEGDEIIHIMKKEIGLPSGYKYFNDINQIIDILRRKEELRFGGFGPRTDWSRVKTLFQEEIAGTKGLYGKDFAKTVENISFGYDERMRAKITELVGKYEAEGPTTWGAWRQRAYQFKNRYGKKALIGLGIGAGLAWLAAELLDRDEPETMNVEDLYEKKGPYSLIAGKGDLMRASMIGKPISDIYKYMTEGEEEPNERQETILETGTALHKWMQKLGIEQGQVRETEQFIYDELNQITGHADITYESGAISDIKSLSEKRWKQIMREGPDPSHVAQVNFYGIMTGAPSVSLQYAKAADPEEHMTFAFTPSQELYQTTMAKVNMARYLVEQSGEEETFSPLLKRLGDFWETAKDWFTSEKEARREYQKWQQKYKEQQKEYGLFGFGSLKGWFGGLDQGQGFKDLFAESFAEGYSTGASPDWIMKHRLSQLEESNPMGTEVLRTTAPSLYGPAYSTGSKIIINEPALSHLLQDDFNFSRRESRMMIPLTEAHEFYESYYNYNLPLSRFRPKFGSHRSPAVIENEAITAAMLDEIAAREGEDIGWFGTSKKFRQREKGLIDQRKSFWNSNDYSQRVLSIYDEIEAEQKAFFESNVLPLIPGDDDAYNTIEGMRHTGWAGANRRYETDFGSGLFFTELAKSKGTSLLGKIGSMLQGATKRLRIEFGEHTKSTFAGHTPIKPVLEGLREQRVRAQAGGITISQLDIDERVLSKASQSGKEHFIIYNKERAASLLGEEQEKIFRIPLLWHEVSEAHYSNLVSPKTLFSTHRSPGVIADEALASKYMGPEYFGAIKKLREEEASHIMAEIQYRASMIPRLLKATEEEQLKVVEKELRKTSFLKESYASKQEIKAQEWTAWRSQTELKGTRIGLKNFSKEIEKETILAKAYTKRVQTIYQNVDEKFERIMMSRGYNPQGQPIKYTSPWSRNIIVDNTSLSQNIMSRSNSIKHTKYASKG